MVGSPFPPRSFSLSLPVADPGAAVGNLKAGVVMHVDVAVNVDADDIGARVLAPRRNGRTSRAARAHPLGLLMAAPSRSSVTVVPTSAAPGNATDGRSPPASSSSPVPVREVPVPAPVPVLAITFSAVGGVVALAIIFALVYVRRVRRRVKSMKRLTNVLGPELAPMSPSQLSQLTDSPRVKSAVAHIAPPRRASDMTAHLPSLSASFVSSPTSIIERPTSIALPVPSVRRSTIILSPAPAGRRPTIQYPDPRCPIRSSQAAVPWPLVTSGSWSDRPLRQSDYEKRNTSSDTSEPTRA